MQYKIIVDKQPSSNPSDERKEYTIDIEELRVKGSVYDSINITPDRTYVMRRLALSEYGVLSELVPPVEEDLGDLNIQLFEGDNYIYFYEMQGNRFCAEYVVKNDFTDQFVTKNEMNSSINQTAQNIELSVNQKLEGYSTTQEMNSAISQSAQSITSSVNQTLTNYATTNDLEGEVTELNSTIEQTAKGINSTVSQKVGKTEIISSINQSAESVKINANKINITANDVLNLLANNSINLTSKNITISSNNFKVDASGNMICNNATMSNATINGGTITINGGTQSSPNFEIVGNTENVRLYPNGIWIYSGSDGGDTGIIIERQNGSTPRISVGQANNPTVIYQNYIKCQSYQNYSLESIKKNISKYDDNALKTILNSDIYKYNLKTEKDADKKHIGFVIGNNYKTPKEVINNEGNAIDLYSCIGILWKAMQELSNKVEVSK